MDSGAIRRRVRAGAGRADRLRLARRGGAGRGAGGHRRACPGRRSKTLPFTTGDLRVYKQRQYVCAVTVAKNPGARRKMSVSLQARGGRPVVDEGRLHLPARARSPCTPLNRCVRLTGAVAGKSRSTGWILC